MKKHMQSNYFYMLMISMVALILSLSEYVTILFATKYYYIPMLIHIVIFIGLFVYTFVFRKKRYFYNLLILIFIVTWMLTLSLMPQDMTINIGKEMISVQRDKMFVLEFRFPGFFEQYEYEYNAVTGIAGSMLKKQFYGLDLNLLISIFMVILNGIMLFFNYKKEGPQEIIQIEPSGSFRKSPYALMVLVSGIGLVLSSIECIFLTYAPLGALIVMIVGSLLFIGILIYILLSHQKKFLYNFLILTFIFIWIVYIGKYLLLSQHQINNGKMYYELGFIFPCLITLKGFDFLSHEVLSTTILYGYANWLFSFGMVIVTSSILYYKEKIVCKRK